MRGPKRTVVVATNFSLASVIPTASGAVFAVTVSSILSALVARCCRLLHLLVPKGMKLLLSTTANIDLDLV